MWISRLFVTNLGRNKTQKAARPPQWKTAAFSVLDPHPAYAFNALRDGTSCPDRVR
jgi:hypothetical protein